MFKQYGNNYAAAIAIGCNYSYYIEKKDTLKAKEAFKAYCSTRYMVILIIRCQGIRIDQKELIICLLTC